MFGVAELLCSLMCFLQRLRAQEDMSKAVCWNCAHRGHFRGECPYRGIKQPMAMGLKQRLPDKPILILTTEDISEIPNTEVNKDVQILFIEGDMSDIFHVLMVTMRDYSAQLLIINSSPPVKFRKLQAFYSAVDDLHRIAREVFPNAMITFSQVPINDGPGSVHIRALNTFMKLRYRLLDRNGTSISEVYKSWSRQLSEWAWRL